MNDKKRIRVVSAAIMLDDRYLITQRMKKAVLPDLWEFPGGKVEEGESDAEALRREVRYRVGVEVQVKEQISKVSRDYTDYVLDLHLYRCTIVEGEPEAKSVQDLAWVTSDQFSSFTFAPADEKSMRALLFG